MSENEIVSNENAAGIIGGLIRKEGIKQREIAEKLGCTRQSINQMLNRTEHMRYDNFYKVINALGYEIILRKKRDKYAL